MQQSFNLEQANMASENLKNTAVAVEAMKDANKQLKSQYKKMNIDKIDQVQDELEDLLEQANEVQETLGRSYAIGDEVDEDELEAELAALGDELDFEEEGEPSYLQETPLNLPNAATSEPIDVRILILFAVVQTRKSDMNENRDRKWRKALKSCTLRDLHKRQYNKGYVPCINLNRLVNKWILFS